MGTPVVLESQPDLCSRALGVPNTSTSEPSHTTCLTSLLPGPSLVQGRLDSDLPASEDSASLPSSSCGLTLSHPTTHEVQPSPWHLTPDMPFHFEELYEPLPGDTISNPSTVSPFIWPNRTPLFINLPSDYSIPFPPSIGVPGPALAQFPNWDLNPGATQVPDPQVNHALSLNERAGDNTIASSPHQISMVSHPAVSTSMTPAASLAMNVLANNITRDGWGDEPMTHHSAPPTCLSSMISPQAGPRFGEESSSAHKRVGSIDKNNSLDPYSGQGKRVCVASKQAEEANAIGA
ncbi:hypothetical protein JVT61DRAFT_10816 [Boletus reticuloceps]|uniref:Uncharacterized protein n=1 Tax=Boletus reticuloceps TaxID=495285 RepID=A0A8I2YFK7_9AGAM|nr:hypothetical protein JVT61DRAFT_10816 [Boletus reticuloceps]